MTQTLLDNSPSKWAWEMWNRAVEAGNANDEKAYHDMYVMWKAREEAERERKSGS